MKRFRISGILMVFCLSLLLIGMSASTGSAADINPVGMVLNGDTVTLSSLGSGDRGSTHVDDLYFWYGFDPDADDWTSTRLQDDPSGITFTGHDGDILYWGAAGNSTPDAPFSETATSMIFSGPSGLGFETIAILWADGSNGSFTFTNIEQAITVSQGSVSPVSSVPIPAAAWLLGSGLVGMLGLRRKLK